MKGSSKPISSPGRTEKFPPPLMRFLKSNVGSRSRGRTRASPMMFMRKNKNNVIVETTQEPSSPKVTCIGQVRVRRSAAANGTARTQRSKSTRRRRKQRERKQIHGRRCCCCCSSCRLKVHKPKWFFSVLKKWICCSSGKKENSTCNSRVESSTQRTETPFKSSTSIASNTSTTTENEEGLVGSNTTNPPNNALILTRCRSAPYRSSSLASRFWGSPLNHTSSPDTTKSQSPQNIPEGENEEGNESKELAVTDVTKSQSPQKHVNGEQLPKEEDVAHRSSVYIGFQFSIGSSGLWVRLLFCSSSMSGFEVSWSNGSSLRSCLAIIFDTEFGAYSSLSQGMPRNTLYLFTGECPETHCTMLAEDVREEGPRHRVHEPLIRLHEVCPTVVDAPQHDSKFILIQKHHNTSTTFPRTPQCKPATFTTPHVVCDLIAQSHTEVSKLANRPTVVLLHAANGPLFNTLGYHRYTFDPTFMLTGPQKFLNKKPSVPEEPEKMVGKIKSAGNAVKGSLRLASKEDVSYKNWGMSSSVNPPLSLEISKFEEQDKQEGFVKYLGQYCNQLKETGGKKNEKDTIAIVVGERAFPRRRRRCYHQYQAQGHSTEDCRALKRKIEKMIQDKLIMVQNVDRGGSSSHGDMQTSG
ncbi:putative photosystem II D2 protein-like [Capsicum annuum]|nr:putative photosystem II D2 protein-like [Capsicum annuum]